MVDALLVTSREVVGVFLKQLWLKFVPVFHGLQRGGCSEEQIAGVVDYRAIHINETY